MITGCLGSREEPADNKLNVMTAMTYVDKIPPELVDTKPRAMPVARL